MATLKDIALRCGVTPTVVSAVLNHRKGTVSCSPETRQLIEQTALQLNYRVNIMARSMVKQRIPIVALMFHKFPDSERIPDRYFSHTTAELSLELLHHELESLIAFYHSEEHQIERFLSLSRNGLIGGVISNLIPGHNAEFIRTLQNSGIPFVLLGVPQIPAVAVSRIQTTPIPGIAELMAHYHAGKCYLHRIFCGKHVFFRNAGEFSVGPFITPIPEITGNPENLIISYGTEFFLNLNAQMKIASPAILEESGFEYLIPRGIPHIICRSSGCGGRPIPAAAAMLANWMQHDVVPEMKQYDFSNPAEFQLYLES